MPCDPELGRFITPDWIVQDPGDPQSLNRYAYARNNPIKYIDPTGNLFWLAIIAIAAIVGAVVNVAVQAAMGNIHSFKDFGKAALVGAVGGAATAAGGLALGPVLGALGVAGSIVATTAGEMAVVAGSAYLSNGVNNALNGQNFNAGGWQSAVLAAGTYGVLKAAGPSIQKALNKIGEKLKPALQKLKQTFNNQPNGPSIGKELRNSIDEAFDDGIQGKITDATGEIPENLYHYTDELSASQIEKGGLASKSGKNYLTPNGNLSSQQATIELALPPGNTAKAAFQINTKGLDPSLFGKIQRVTGNVYNRGGGGTEVTYSGKIPKSNVKRIK